MKAHQEPRRCRYCNQELPVSSHNTRQFCNGSCRKMLSYRKDNPAPQFKYPGGKGYKYMKKYVDLGICPKCLYVAPSAFDHNYCPRDGRKLVGYSEVPENIKIELDRTNVLCVNMS